MLNSLKLKTLSSKKIFLIDGIGALLTALILLVVLYPLSEQFGMPRSTLIFLALLAITFCIFSSSCYVLSPQKWKPFLSVIILANILYCMLTSALLVYHYSRLTLLGFAYFSIEILVIILLVVFELKYLKTRSH